MGILDRLGFARDVLTSDTTVVIPPWPGGDVSQVASLPTEVAEAFGINTNSDVVTRKQAMTIPAVKQGRNVIAGKIGTAPLACTRTRAGKTPERVDRPFFNQPDPLHTLASTLTWTVDDLLFNGWSLWRVMTRDPQRYPLTGERVAPWRISPTAEGIRVDHVLVDQGDLILFEGPDEGLLKTSGRTLRTALMLEDTVRRAASADVPVGLFEDTVGQMLADEVEAFLATWEAHRKKRSTGYVPNGLKYVNPNADPEKLQLKDARAFQAAEVARALNLPAYAINAPTSDSLTYSTTESNRRDLVEITYAPFVAAIEGRLSMGDVTPLGTRVHLDFSAFIRGDLKNVIETGAAAVTAGLMTIDEVRTQWLQLPPLPDQEDTDAA